MTRSSLPLLPDYEAGCISNLVPELIKTVLDQPAAEWLPEGIARARQVVLLVLDGLGWTQLQERAAMMPTLSGFAGGAITSVAPTTTVTNLTSLVTGRAPASHGILGYRLAIHDDTLNVLRWAHPDGTPFDSVVPEEFQTHLAFAANPVPVVTRAHFAGTGFTRAHLQGVNFVGYAAASSLPVEIWRLAREGEQFIYAYYEGIDTIAHLHGFGEHYEAEMYTADRLVRDILGGLPARSVLVVTSDHGQVEVGENTVDIDKDLAAMCTTFSGEARFRWLHVDEPRRDAALELAKERHGHHAWVKTRDEVVGENWFGGPLNEKFATRIGDIALVAREAVAFRDPTHDGERNMACRHGSLTADEVLVPLLAHRV